MFSKDHKLLRITLGVNLVIVVLLAFVCGLGWSLRYVDSMYVNLPDRATRTEVSEKLYWFFEKEVPREDIPPEYTLPWPVTDSMTVCRYTFLMPPLSFHCIYEGDGKLILQIPTYE